MDSSHWSPGRIMEAGGKKIMAATGSPSFSLKGKGLASTSSFVKDDRRLMFPGSEEVSNL